MPAASRPGAATGTIAATNVEYIPYGLPAAGHERAAGGAGSEPACELVAGYGEVEAEYASIRKGAGLLDSPHRGTLLVTGADRRAFLNRMLTQELKDLAPGTAKPAFWLNRKGRIEADLLAIELGDRVIMALDILQAAAAARSLSEFLFSEDVEIHDESAAHHHIAVHGQMALQVIGAASGEATFTLGERCAAQALIGGTNVVIARRDQTGETGLELIMPVEHAAAVWDQLLATDAAIGHGRRRVRPIGWHSFNIARIEAGTPLFNVDFGTTSLPHETGVLHDRVSFTKGCYLGQEIVARTEHLGRPKLNLIGLRMQANRLPVAGAQVFAAAGEGTAGSIGDQIGVVTSSTLSPMLGAAPIAFAMVRASHAEIGRAVVVNAEGESCAAVIHPLRFWPGPEPSSP